MILRFVFSKQEPAFSQVCPDGPGSASVPCEDWVCGSARTILPHSFSPSFFFLPRCLLPSFPFFSSFLFLVGLFTVPRGCGRGLKRLIIQEPMLLSPHYVIETVALGPIWVRCHPVKSWFPNSCRDFFLFSKNHSSKML